VQAAVPHLDVAIATAILLTITQIGGAVGGAVSGIIWTTFLPRKLAHNLPNATPEDIARIFGSMSVALSYEPGTAERNGIDEAYFDVQRMLNLAALLGLVPALISALLMHDIRMGHEPSACDERFMPMGDVIGESLMAISTGLFEVAERKSTLQMSRSQMMRRLSFRMRTRHYGGPAGTEYQDFCHRLDCIRWPLSWRYHGGSASFLL
jgi:hypothetical protein